MSPPRPSAANAIGGQRSQKRASSFAGFFSKILPSNRPEQGGTRRTIDGTGDNGNELNELTRWNLAKEKNPVRQISTDLQSDSSHRRVWSWSPQKGDSRFVENLPRDRSSEREHVPDTPDRDPIPPRRSETLTRAEIHKLLKSKEETRRNRRSLKESGDWLGVQGADPYSGEYTVLTPTDTLSSDTTPSSTRSKLAGLARKRKAAKLEYEQIRLAEEREKEKASLDREQAKLNKIERVKEDLRRQQQFTKWSQHKRQWSSAAEPNLSPIAQSLDSVALGSSEDSSLLFPEMPPDSFSPGSEDPSPTVPNFSRPTRPPVSTKAAQAERLSCDSTRAQGQRRFDQSTDTIIHHAPGNNIDPASLTRPASQPSGSRLDAEQPEIGRTKSERHFLWRRRKETDPGKSVSSPPVSFAMSMTTRKRRSNSIESTQRDHFADLAIPDYRLHLISPEPEDTPESQSTTSEDTPSTTTNLNLLEAMGEIRMALSSTTDLVFFQGNGESNLGENGATATSSQSKLKATMKRSSIRRKLVPSLLTMAPTRDMERNHQSSSRTFGVQDHAVNNSLEDTQACQSQHLQSDLPGRTSLEPMEGVSPFIGIHTELGRRESVSIPTTTTTGCAPDQQNQHGSTKLKWGARSDRIDGAMDTINVPTTPASIDQHECRMTTASVLEKQKMPSPPITLQNDLPKHEPVQGTLETDTISTHHVTQEKPPTGVPTLITPKPCRLIQQNLETNDTGRSKEPNVVDKTETATNQTLERIEANETSTPEGQTQRISQECHKSPAQVSTAQEAYRRLSTEEQKESIVEEAAGIAMLRSRTEEIVRSKSADYKEPQKSSPQKGKKHTTDTKIAEPKHLSQQRRPKGKRHNEEGAGIELLSKHEHVRSATQAQSNKRPTDAVGSPETALTVVRLCKTAYIILLGLACTWWIMVRPAFDQRSDLWRRRHRKQSTWKDVAVFISAGVFCLVGALACWYALKVLWWVY
ncbi:hypothetical protein F4776DRAFT_659275 [Hypoxylon sp. NC0597]|nr:hypothetical protein F4776DRAFT_659275 [Hypoxylon sp. NC0597]